MSIYNQHFYHDTIRKYVTVVGNLINNLKVKRYDSDGNLLEERPVEMVYSPKEKFISRLLQDPDLKTKEAITLPKIGYQMTAMYYDTERKLANRRYFKFRETDADTASKIYVPQPWNFAFEVSIIAKSQDDMFQIVEQILPFFGPDLVFSMKTMSTPPVKFDVPISLVGVTPSDNYEGSFEDRRMIIYTMQFLLKGYMFGPVRTGGSIIKQIDVSLFDFGQLDIPLAERKALSLIHIEPFFEGKPLEEINMDDDYVVKTTITNG